MDLKTAPVIRKRLSDFVENGLYGYTVQDRKYDETVCSWMERTPLVQTERGGNRGHDRNHICSKYRGKKPLLLRETVSSFRRLLITDLTGLSAIREGRSCTIP